MPRETFQQELDELISDVAAFGAEVEESLKNAVAAMEARDAGVARQELGVDIRYKTRGMDIEREHICQAIAETADSERDEDLETALVEMARTARNIFSEGLDIYKNRDIVRARNLQAKDDKVDVLYSEAMNVIANPSEGRGGAPEWRMRAALMVHYLERISDHGVGIGGSTVFLVTGERIEEAMQQYTDRELSEE